MTLDEIAQANQSPVLIGGNNGFVPQIDNLADPVPDSSVSHHQIIIPTPQELQNEAASSQKSTLKKTKPKKIINKKVRIEPPTDTGLPTGETSVPLIPIVSTTLVGLAAKMNGTPQTEGAFNQGQASPSIAPVTNAADLPKTPPSRRLLFSLALFVLVSVIGLLIMSFFYRFHLSREKRAPFTAPSFLEFLFPRPVNYENEVTLLCMKYMQH